jgi:GT2 family glycosyltransferase
MASQIDPARSNGTTSAPSPREDELERLQSQLDAYEARVSGLEKRLGEALAKTSELTKVRNQLTKTEVELQTAYLSMSWRVTAPLRGVSRMARAARLLIETMQRQVHFRGGMWQAFEYYITVFKREGVAGLKSRLARLASGVGFAHNPLSDAAYNEWIVKHDSMTGERSSLTHDMLHAMSRRPLISIVVPTYNSNEEFLSKMIASVTSQIYPSWELCIADDASTTPHVRKVLEAAAQGDARIKVVFREENGHISEASNSALSIASGDFVALLDHDDILPSHALLMVAHYINLYPSARMLYSDEDKLTPEGKRTTPYFKSDWNPEMFLTQNMFSHLGVFDTALVRSVGGFRKGFEGSQDYDLALRCVEVAGNDAVVHIPHVLYHWRISPGSTAGSGSEKPYAQVAAERAVAEHLERCGIAATIEQPHENLATFRIRYALPHPSPLVSIVIPTRDGVELLRQCVDSILERTLYSNYEIIVVDNGSVEPETLAYLDKQSEQRNLRILRDDSPFNFSALNNRAVAIANGDYVCLLNNDVEVISPDWLGEMVSLAAQPENGAVGAALWYPNNTLQHGGVIIGLGGVAGHMHHTMQRGHFGYFGRAVATQNLSAVTAACLVIKKSVYDEVGGLDEGLAVAFNDVDFCLRVREAGYRNVWTPYAELYHHESATRGSDMDPDKYARFVKEVRWMEARWGDKLKEDPAYNPNLTFDTTALPFSLADPPRRGMLD